MLPDSITIRKAKKDDCKEIMKLIQELADYEKMPHGPKISADVLERDGFGEHPVFSCIVAEEGMDNKNLVGYTLFFPTYSTWEGRNVYMEDIYVTPSHRKRGIGNAMWKQVVRISLEEGCTRCNFAVLDWNKNSIDFYEKRGATNLTQAEGWNFFRLDKNAMEKFVSSDGSLSKTS